VQSNTIFALLADFVACYAVNEEVNKNVRFLRVTSLAAKITIAHCGTCQADHCTALHRSSRTIGQGYFFNHNTTAERRAHITAILCTHARLTVTVIKVPAYIYVQHRYQWSEKIQMKRTFTV
jgi:hypothetical protein